MTTRTTSSLEEALGYAQSAVGHKKTAQLVRAALFSDGIEDSRLLAPQLAEALMQAIERRRPGTAN